MRFIELDELRARGEGQPYATSDWEGWTTLGRAATQNFENVLRAFDKSPVHEADFNVFRAFEGDVGLFVDIGANMGTSIVSLRNVCSSMRILSFELIPLLEGVLRLVRERTPNSDFRMLGLSDAPQRTSLYIPVFNSLLCTPWTSLSTEVFETDLRRDGWRQITGQDDFELLRLDVEISTVDTQMLRPTAMKIDVEGAELKVLNGARATLTKHRPVLLIEDGHQPETVAWLGALGYKAYNYQPHNDALQPLEHGVISYNTFYVHPEGVDLASRGVRFDP